MATFEQFEDEILTCPYNRLHKVAKRRFQIHVNKCAKTYNYSLVTCPYNNSHRVRREDLNEHIIGCPDNRPVVRQIVEQHFVDREKEIKKEAARAEEKL